MPVPDATEGSRELTPSEIVLLCFDKICPPEPTAPTSGVMFEVQTGWPFLLVGFFSTGFAIGKVDPSTPTSQAVGAAVTIGLAIGWWFYRRSQKKVEVPDGGLPVFQRGSGEVLWTALSAALLANEQTGAGELAVVEGQLVARFRPGASPWPRNSLEDELRREREMPVADMIYDWMADNSHFPQTRAWKLIRHSVELREKDGAPLRADGSERAVDWAPVAAMLEACKQQRPEVWKALEDSIGKGLGKRKVEPRQKYVGGGRSIPEYYYQEAPVSELDAGTAEGGDAGDTTTPKAATLVPTWVSAVLLLIALATVVWALGNHPEHVTAAVLNFAIILWIPVGHWFALRRWGKLNEVRTKYGLAREDYRDLSGKMPRQSWPNLMTATAMLAGVLAIPAAIWGGWWVLAAIVVTGASSLGESTIYGRFRKKTAAEVVRARVNALSNEAAAPEVEEDSHEEEAVAAASLVPHAAVPAWELPAVTAEMRERLSEDSRRPEKPLRLVLLRVFGSPAYNDLVELIKPWRRVGTIEHLEGYDTVGESGAVQAAVEAGDVDRALVKNMEEVRAQLEQAHAEWDAKEGFSRHAFQCTNAVWRQAILLMLQRADAVLMDLSSLSVENQGCAWELGQLLDRVALSKVTLLVNENTDVECLRGILDHAAAKMPADSPNRNHAGARWQLVQVGGLAERQAGESYYEWKRRMDRRLDPVQLAAWLVRTAGGGVA